MINIKRFKKFLQKELLLLSFPYENIYSSLQSLAHNDKKKNEKVAKIPGTIYLPTNFND